MGSSTKRKYQGIYLSRPFIYDVVGARGLVNAAHGAVMRPLRWWLIPGEMLTALQNKDQQHRTRHI